MSNTIFLLAGRTAGPILPLITITKHLSNIEPIIIGVRNGFEERVVSPSLNIPLLFVPEVKLSSLSFSSEDNIQNKLLKILDLIKMSFKLIWSVFRCLMLLLRHRPLMILTAGSFVTVPMVYATRILRIFRLFNTYLVVHQQDPVPGLSNRMAAKDADVLTCVYKESKKAKNFGDAQLIPNPFDDVLYKREEIRTNYNSIKDLIPSLALFLETESKLPLLFIYGGGSGSEVINHWVDSYLEEIVQKYRVIHLYGALNDEREPAVSDNYYSIAFLDPFVHFPVVFTASDLVLTRAGLGAITEIDRLQKPGFIVPMKGSHQEKNADVSTAITLDQDQSEDWLAIINDNYPASFEKKNIENDHKKYLDAYYNGINELINGKSMEEVISETI
jgi:UDP-N-acetylglucosamine--N-acetylmuramyl-(pentapeptide) pyrophosphoryl-undecaprenol N-acetylglucosamine transferase